VRVLTLILIISARDFDVPESGRDVNYREAKPYCTMTMGQIHDKRAWAVSCVSSLHQSRDCFAWHWVIGDARLVLVE
jgi:hypothetical protein